MLTASMAMDRQTHMHTDWQTHVHGHTHRQVVVPAGVAGWGVEIGEGRAQREQCANRD